MPICHSLRCIFVHIPKTAGSSIEKALGVLGDWRVENLKTFFGLINTLSNQHIVDYTAFLQHLKFIDLQRCIGEEVSKNYFSFTIVRNPWERLVSLYCRKDVHLIQAARNQGIELNDMSFEDFVSFAVEFRHVHLLSQHTFITDSCGRVLVDFVARFEKLNTHFKEIAHILGIVTDLPHINPSKASDRLPYQDFYTANSRELVNRFYAKDIELFGYEF